MRGVHWSNEASNPKDSVVSHHPCIQQTRLKHGMPTVCLPCVKHCGNTDEQVYGLPRRDARCVCERKNKLNTYNTALGYHTRDYTSTMGGRGEGSDQMPRNGIGESSKGGKRGGPFLKEYAIDSSRQWKIDINDIVSVSGLKFNNQPI